MSSTATTSTETNTGLNAEALRHSLEQIAAANGISRWDLGAACSTDLSVQVDRGEAKQMKGAQRSSITVRVWNDQGLVGVTSTSDLSAAGLERALSGAKEASAFGNADDIPAFSPLATAPLAQLDQPIHAPQGILRLLDTLKGAEQDLLSRHEAISTVPYNGLAERSSERIYLKQRRCLPPAETEHRQPVSLCPRRGKRTQTPQCWSRTPGLWRRRPRHCWLHQRGS